MTQVEGQQQEWPPVGSEAFGNMMHQQDIDALTAELEQARRERDEWKAKSDLFITEVRHIIDWPYHDHEQQAIRRMKEAYEGNPRLSHTSRELLLMAQLATLQQQLEEYKAKAESLLAALHDWNSAGKFASRFHWKLSVHPAIEGLENALSDKGGE